jgi:hypothetical protein
MPRPPQEHQVFKRPWVPHIPGVGCETAQSAPNAERRTPNAGTRSPANGFPPKPRPWTRQVHPTARSRYSRHLTFNTIRPVPHSKVPPPTHSEKSSPIAPVLGQNPKTQTPVSTAGPLRDCEQHLPPNPDREPRQVHPTARSRYSRHLTFNTIRPVPHPKVLPSNPF